MLPLFITNEYYRSIDVKSGAGDGELNGTQIGSEKA
jgi:hypothetical protein